MPHSLGAGLALTALQLILIVERSTGRDHALYGSEWKNRSSLGRKWFWALSEKTTADVRPTIKSRATGPNHLESRLLSRLSPIMKY